MVNRDSDKIVINILIRRGALQIILRVMIVGEIIYFVYLRIGTHDYLIIDSRIRIYAYMQYIVSDLL